MANTQKVSCTRMEKDAQTLQQLLKDIPQEIEQTRIAMTNLAHCWEGPAWEAYQIQVNKDLEELGRVYKTLVALQQSLGRSREKYLRTEYDVYTDFKTMII